MVVPALRAMWLTQRPQKRRLPLYLTSKSMHKETLTLYELSQMVREALAITMPDEYWVEAEISEMREVRGHCYMELVQKDMAGNTPVAKGFGQMLENNGHFFAHISNATPTKLCAPD